MASFDELRQQAEKTANIVAEKAVEAAEAAGDWADKSRPEMDEAFEKGEAAAENAMNKVADGLGSVYEAIKNKAEEFTGMDADGDGVVGNTGEAPGEVKAGVEVAAEAVAGAAGAAVGFAKGALDAIAQKVSEAAAEANAEAEPAAEIEVEAEAEPEAETEVETELEPEAEAEPEATE